MLILLYILKKVKDGIKQYIYKKGENVINVISDVGAVELETSYYIEKH